MSDTHECRCLICGNFFDIERYAGGVCDCGQEYTYDECYQIVLTDEQIETLRAKKKLAQLTRKG